MNGNQAYNLKFEMKIDHILNQYPQLLGYRNYLTDSSISTVYKYVYYVSCFLEFVNKRQEELIFDDFTNYLYNVQINHKGEPTTASYKIAVYSALKKYNMYLVAANILQHNYMSNIRRPKYVESQKTVEKREIGYLDEKEIKTYIYNVKNGITTNKIKVKEYDYYRERDMAIVMVFLNTGIRCSALIKLDVDNINLDNSEIIVVDKGSKVNKHMISEDTKECLVQWINKRNQILQGREENALFISDRKTRIGQTTVSDIIKKYTKNIIGKNITPHKLRATYGTQLYNATKDLFFVQEMMGHSNPQTTALYIRDKSDMKEKASNIMGNLTKLD